MALTAIASLDPDSPDAPDIALEALREDDEFDYEVIFDPEFESFAPEFENMFVAAMFDISFEVEQKGPAISNSLRLPYLNFNAMRVTAAFMVSVHNAKQRRCWRTKMSDLKHIHNAIIDNPDFNLTVAAKRDLRELCAWVESYRKDGQKVLDENNGRIEQLEAALHFYADNHKRPNEGPWGARQRCVI
jgi:hypothetical protein